MCIHKSFQYLYYAMKLPGFNIILHKHIYSIIKLKPNILV